MIKINTNGKAWLYQSTPLVGYDILGTVERPDGHTGALVRNKKTGLYAQANAGKIRTLPQIKLGEIL